MIQYSLGDVVLSLKGKDAGETFIVACVNNGFAYVANGKRYSINFPKKKNLKHLKLISLAEETFAEKIISGKSLGAKTLKEYIKSAINKKQEEQLSVER